MKRFAVNKYLSSIGQVAVRDEKREARLEQKSQEVRLKFAELTDEELNESMASFIRCRQRWNWAYLGVYALFMFLVYGAIGEGATSPDQAIQVVVPISLLYIIGAFVLDRSEKRAVSEYELERERRFAEECS